MELPVFRRGHGLDVYFEFPNLANVSRRFQPLDAPGFLRLQYRSREYFLLPAVRAAYFNAKLRWWETKPRYLVNIPASFGRKGASSARGTMVNLSEGGAFLKTARKYKKSQKIHVQFYLLGRDYEV